MPRPKKPTYEYVASLKSYRKRIKDSDGKYVAIYGKTVAELTEKLVAAEEAIRNAAEEAANPYVRDYAAEWLKLVTADMSAKNKESYEEAIDLHIVTVIGGMRMQDVRPDDARLVMVALGGMSDSLQRKVLNTMRKMFENAVDNELISKNPCDKLRSKGKKAKEKIALTAEQKQVLLDAVKGTRAEPFVMLGLYTGMRREELLALQWDCVHMPKKKEPYVEVKRALRWEKNRPVVDDVLKSDAAYRVIAIPEVLAEYLKTIKQSSGYVIGGTPLTQTQFKNLWAIVTRRQVGERTYRASRTETPTKVTFTREKGAKSRGGDFRYTIDFDVSPHILRHTYITDLILSGANLKTVQYLAGHSDIKVTLDIYTHLMDKSPKKLLEEVNKAFEVKTEVKK